MRRDSILGRIIASLILINQSIFFLIAFTVYAKTFSLLIMLACLYFIIGRDIYRKWIASRIVQQKLGEPVITKMFAYRNDLNITRRDIGVLVLSKNHLVLVKNRRDIYAVSLSDIDDLDIEIVKRDVGYEGFTGLFGTLSLMKIYVTEAKITIIGETDGQSFEYCFWCDELFRVRPKSYKFHSKLEKKLTKISPSINKKVNIHKL